MSAQRPIETVKLGLLTAAIWKNEPSQEGKLPWYNITLERSFKQDDGKYGSTHSFSRDDLLPLAKLLDKTHTRILQIQDDDWALQKKMAERTAGNTR